MSVKERMYQFYSLSVPIPIKDHGGLQLISLSQHVLGKRQDARLSQGDLIIINLIKILYRKKKKMQQIKTFTAMDTIVSLQFT